MAADQVSRLLTHRVLIRGGGGCCRGRGGVLVVICSDAYGGQGFAPDVVVVRRGKHHGGLVCLRILMVEVDHAPAAERGRSLTMEKQVEEKKCDKKRRKFYYQVAPICVWFPLKG